MKRAATAGFAFHPQAAAHQLHQADTDAETKPGAAIFSGGGTVGLCKWLKNFFLFFGGNADSSVADEEVQFGAVFGGRRGLDPDRNFSLLREFDGVSHEIDEHLPEPAGIPDEQVRRVFLDVPIEADILLLSAHLDCLQGIADALAEGSSSRIAILSATRGGRRGSGRDPACPLRFWRNRGCH